MKLADKVILITGASRGIGAAIAEACAAEGAHLALAAKTVDKHPKLPGTLRETAALVEAQGREALVIKVDVRDPEQVQAMVDQTMERFGRIDAYIHNAGAIWLADVADFPIKRYDLVHAVNSRGAFLAAQACIPHMREQGGHIIMMSPPVNIAAGGGKAPYLHSKWGMTLLARAIDSEEPTIAGSALWPVAAIRTAATVVFGLGDETQWRTPAIMAEATVELLAKDPANLSFKAWLDEDLLAEKGITDLSPYRCHPDHEPPPISIELVDPDWRNR